MDGESQSSPTTFARPRPIMIPEEPVRYNKTGTRARSKSPKTPTNRSRSPKSGSRSPAIGTGQNLSRVSDSFGGVGLAHSYDTLSTLDLADAVNDGNTTRCNMIIDQLILTTIINAQDARGMTLLHLAARSGQEDMALNLLHRGADMTIRDKMGWTPLIWACMEGHHDLTKMFIVRGADVNMVDESNATPLHFAAMEGQTDIVTLLLQYGADLEPKDNFNQTPVMRACTHGHEEVALLLMEAGADFTLPKGVVMDDASPLQQACILFSEDFGFPHFMQLKKFRDANTWTKEDGIIILNESEEDTSESDEHSDEDSVSGTTDGKARRKKKELARKWRVAARHTIRVRKWAEHDESEQFAKSQASKDYKERKDDETDVDFSKLAFGTMSGSIGQQSSLTGSQTVKFNTSLTSSQGQGLKRGEAAFSDGEISAPNSSRRGSTDLGTGMQGDRPISHKAQTKSRDSYNKTLQERRGEGKR